MLLASLELWTDVLDKFPSQDNHFINLATQLQDTIKVRQDRNHFGYVESSSNGRHSCRELWRYHNYILCVHLLKVKKAV